MSPIRSDEFLKRLKTINMLEYFRGLIRILNRTQKIKILILQFFFLLSALIQVAGVASIAPFIAVISNPSLVESNPLLMFLFDFLNRESMSEFLMAYAVSVAAFILASNIVGAFVLWLLFHYSINLGAELQNRLYSNYMDNEYIYFADRNSSSLISNLTMQIPRFIYMVIQPMLLMVSQIFVVLIIVIGLLYLDPVLALSSAMIVGGIYFGIYLTVRKKMVDAGETVTDITKKKLLLLNESIIGIKEVKLLDVEGWYGAELNETTKRGLNASAFIALAGDLPKFIVETIVFIAILGLSIYLILTEEVSGSAMALLSFYAMAGYKLLPAAQTIYKSVASIKANGSTVSVIEKELEESGRWLRREQENIQKPLANGSNFDIHLVGVSYKYPRAKNNTVANLDLIIKEYSMVAFVGASGAGKSTVANLILGLLHPTDGKVKVGDRIIDKSNLKAWQANVGYVPQSIFLIDDSVAKNIAFGIASSEIDFERLKEAARKANILDFIFEQKEGFEFRVGENGGRLSGGQRQRIGIARALYKKPRILVLDEATSALDNVTERRILHEIHQLAKSMTIIMIAHRLTTIENADEIVVFENGAISARGDYLNLVDCNDYFRSLVSRNKDESSEKL